MFDGTLARRSTANGFRRADTARDERADVRVRPFEDTLKSALGRLQGRRISRRKIEAFGSLVTAQMEASAPAGDDELRGALSREIEVLRTAPRSSDVQARVLGVVGEACRRIFGYRPHHVQFMGARALLMGELAEMQTGEGKTLVAGLAATVMASGGCSVHVVSTNDYLASRDAEEMQQLFGFFGLRASSVVEGMEPEDRRAAYRKNICYVSGKELVFDYLKDRLAGHGYLPNKVSFARALGVTDGAGEEPLIPSLHCVIVDEADSVLIDEARTPLIISREAEGLYEPALIQWAIDQARRMREGVDFSFGANRSVDLVPEALRKCDDVPTGVRPVWSSARWKAVLLRQAITALHAFVLDQHYILVEGKVQIVDESTGRVMADRTWEQGLHQLIECKEGLEQSGSRETLAKMTFQRFFRRYFLLSGLSGTVSEARNELWAVYGLRVRNIPPNRPNRRQRLPDLCADTPAQKWAWICDQVVEAKGRGQPVLVGTRSVEASEAIGAALEARGVEHVVLNARQDKGESEIIGRAGAAGHVTVATNMAGRGTDIKLTEQARAAGGLHVILTEFHESPRVDRQLFGRSGRQGDPGSICAIVCAEDALFEKQLPGATAVLRRVRAQSLRRYLLARARAVAQWRSERLSLKARKQTLRQDRTLHNLVGFAGKVL